jgi:AAA family ATP:ADP antiporter
MSTPTTTAPHRLRARAEAAVAALVVVRPHEMAPLMSAASTFFFVSHLSRRTPPSQPNSSHRRKSEKLIPRVMQILSAYFVVLPLRDEGAISLGLGALPGLFAGSLVLTVLAAPVASLVFSLPSIPKTKVRAFLTYLVLV